MGEDGCDGDDHIVAVASLCTALVRFAEESTEKSSEEDWRGGIWTIVMIVSGSVRFDDDSSGLLKNNLGRYYSICIYLQ